jgi:hypothetical protein
MLENGVFSGRGRRGRRRRDYSGHHGDAGIGIGIGTIIGSGGGSTY